MEEAVKVVKYQPNEIPDLTRDDLDNSVLEVGMYNVKEDAKFDDTSFCHTHRNEFGTPSNIQDKPYSAYVQQKAKDENELVILGDISRLFNRVATFSKDNKLKKKLTEEKPEINPQGAADPSDLWDLTTDHTSLYLQNQEDPNVEITSPYPVAILMEDETNLDALPDNPNEEPVATLKFPKFTSRAIRRFHTRYCKEKVAEAHTPERFRTTDPADAEFIPDEWTPGRPRSWKAALKKMVEEAEEEEEVATGRLRRRPPIKLTYDTPGHIAETPVKKAKRQ